MAGRKYGLGKYGASTYDLGETPPPVWEPIPDPPPEIWVPIPEPPPVFVCPPIASGPEIWTPVAPV